jgi:hypothetical protein
VTAGCM